MRQIFIQVPEGQGGGVLALAEAHEGLNLACFPVTSDDGPAELVLVHVSNRQVEKLLGALADFPDARVTMAPQGLLAFSLATAEAPPQVTDVEDRSPIEIFLAGLQSIGSWRGFVGYGVVGGLLVWIGMFTNSLVTLVAAMLVSPFAGPAMTAAIASARGDRMLLGRSLLRYFAGLGIAVVVAGLASLIAGQEVVTPMMQDFANVSSAAVLLPLIAGAAGALNLVQSERNSLVSGAATGILIAVALAPSAGLLGMSIAMREWQLSLSGLFLIVMQLAGINLSGALVFRLYGLAPRGAHYQRGQPWLVWAALGVSVVLLAGLLLVQFWSKPELQRQTIEQRAVTDVRRAVDGSDLAALVEADLRFTRPNIPGQDTLLGVIYVQRAPDVPEDDAAIRAELTQAIRERLRAGYDVTPLIDVIVLEPPS